MKRKFLRLFLAIVIVSLPVFALEIDVWLTGLTNEQLRIVSEVTENDFTSKTGINVNFMVFTVSDTETKLLLAAASGEGPDIAGSGPLFLPELGLRGALIDLSTLPDFDEIYSRANPRLYRSLQYQGLTFGIPHDSTITTAYIRDDIFASLGLSAPKTWLEVKQILPKLQAQGSSMLMQFRLTEILYADVNMFMWQRGADDYTPDLSRSGYDSPECIEAFKEYLEFYTLYKIPSEIPALQGFIDGSLAMVFQYSPFHQNLMNAAPQILGKWSLAQVPGTETAGRLDRTANAGGQAIGIFANSTKKAEAWEFIKWFTSDPIQVTIANRIINEIPGSFYMPANRAAIMMMDMDKETLTLFCDALEEGSRSIYGLVAPRNRRRYLQMAVQRCILQGEDPEKSIRQAANEHNAEIEKKQIEYDRFIKKLLEAK
ncbi:MAG: extracellular solute-binding protein [Bacillota bacterium]|nr:extracellular solute-binding protein [Bacillota bacterium]MDD4264631.1 extracellular solute-binding protein [Bacillota bacterium]